MQTRPLLLVPNLAYSSRADTPCKKLPATSTRKFNRCRASGCSSEQAFASFPLVRSQRLHASSKPHNLNCARPLCAIACTDTSGSIRVRDSGFWNLLFCWACRVIFLLVVWVGQESARFGRVLFLDTQSMLVMQERALSCTNRSRSFLTLRKLSPFRAFMASTLGSHKIPCSSHDASRQQREKRSSRKPQS